MEREEMKTLMTDIPQFDRLNDEERDIIAGKIAFKAVQAGTLLMKEGAVGGSLYFVASGQVEIAKESVSGAQVVIARFGRGSTLGEMSLIDANLSKSATARVVEDAELLEMTKKNFDGIINDYPRIGVKILLCVALSLSARLRHTSGRFADLLG